MMAAISVFGTNQEFDDFLYAPVGGESDQMPLSVLSALTRLNLDPWGEASELSKMSKETAIQRLASLISRLPATQLRQPDCLEIAKRLVALLPPPSRGIALPGVVTVIGLPMAPSRTVVMLLAAIILGAAALLFAMAREQASQNTPPELPPSSKSLPQTL